MPNSLGEKLSGGYWNTRIIREYIDGEYDNGEEYHEITMGIHEVYYDRNNVIITWTEHPIRMNFLDKEDFAARLQQILDAAEKPILELKDGQITETSEIWKEKE